MWRDTCREVTVLGLNAWALAPFPLILFSGWSWWAVYISVANAIAIVTLRALGLSIVGGLRYLRAFVAGPDRPAVPAWKRRHFA